MFVASGRPMPMENGCISTTAVPRPCSGVSLGMQAVISQGSLAFGTAVLKIGLAVLFSLPETI